MRPERTVNILVLDEADGGLDQPGLEAYGSLLEQLRGEYESVFVISHRTELSGVNFDHTWTVEKRAGISHIRQE
jgi:ABC-type Mn2+/Zn2+ transport system ATPase subunit